MTRFVEVFLATAVQRRGAARAPDRPARAYETTRELPPLPESALRGGTAGAMPEGHTLHRLAGELTATFGGRVVRASSPQGRFADDAALLDAPVLIGAEAWGKHLFVEFAGDRFVHVHLGLYGKFDVRTGSTACRSRSARSGCGWHDATTCATPTCAARPCATWSPASSATRSWPGSAPTRCAPTPTRAGRGGGSGAADRPIGGLLMDQEVLAGVGNVYRAEVLFRHRIDPLRPGHTLRAGQWQAMWDDLVELMAEGVRDRPDRHRPARAHARGDGPPAARRRPRRRGLRLPPHRPALPRLRHHGPHRGARGAQPLLVSAMSARFRSRAVQ